MSKAHRGKGLREEGGDFRGTCPLCKRSGIKLVYEQELNEKKYHICKQCNAALAKGKMKEAVAALG